jgi:hypothetical protein
MKSPKTKFALSIFALAAVLTSPASAKKAQQATQNNGSAVYGSPLYGAIPGYGNEGNVVAIPDPDQSGL